jgi:hypothetical protein
MGRPYFGGARLPNGLNAFSKRFDIHSMKRAVSSYVAPSRGTALDRGSAHLWA